MREGRLSALDRHRDERAEELFELAGILQDEGLIADAGPIVQAAGQCRRAPRTVPPGEPGAGRTYWGYEVSELRINLEEQRHARPRKAVATGAVGVLSVTVQEYVPGSETEVGGSYPLLRRLDTDFFMDVHLEVDGVRHPLRACWHVDTHLHTGTRTHGVHPRFHYQVGGERLDELDELIRGAFIPEAPRMACAPLDAVLAIDFVLGQYCGEAWEMLPDILPAYGRLRKKPVQRYWGPYFKTLAEGIDHLDEIHDGGPARELIPNIASR